jgi:Zn-finger protein
VSGNYQATRKALKEATRDMDKQLENWRESEYSFFSHKKCEAFPCHETSDPDGFNCLFCYCPLYVLGRDCGGEFKYLQSGVKDCTGCTLPHERDSYGYVTGRFSDIVDKMKSGLEGGK